MPCSRTQNHAPGADQIRDLVIKNSWNPHVDRITGNTNRTLGFVQQNIKTKMSNVRETAYNTLVRPQLKYTSAVWDPHTKVRTSQIEQVQQRAACWDSQQL